MCRNIQCCGACTTVGGYTQWTTGSVALTGTPSFTGFCTVEQSETLKSFLLFGCLFQVILVRIRLILICPQWSDEFIADCAALCVLASSASVLCLHLSITQLEHLSRGKQHIDFLCPTESKRRRGVAVRVLWGKCNRNQKILFSN